MNTSFENARTIETLKAETKSQKLMFSYAQKYDASGKLQPIYIKDENGNVTDVKAIAVQNEAGKTVAWCSRQVAAEIAAGKNPANHPNGLSVVDVVDTDSGDTISTKLVHRGASNLIEGFSL